ncbi:MAG: TlyA family rRNA (cytidine-2'-O)-methyltransferase [Candidatus Dojkabacteria bacterium]
MNDTKIDLNRFVSRAGEKLQFALETFNIDVKGKVCADLGANAGGFTDSLLQNDASKVYCVDTGYGVLDWKLRNNPQVIPMERTNALYVKLPEKVDLVVIDVGWTKQEKILPKAYELLKEKGEIVSLVKPHYEATTLIKKERLTSEEAEQIVNSLVEKEKSAGRNIVGIVKSPIEGKKAGNIEYLIYLKKNSL